MPTSNILPNAMLRLLTGLTPYQDALHLQQQAVAQVMAGAPNQLIFCQHPPVYTMGSSADAKDILQNPTHTPVLPTGRGGQITWHGPGQRVVYPIHNLAPQNDLRAHIQNIQNWLIASLKDLGIEAHTNEHIGVWVHTSQGEAKIAAIGVRVRRWVAFHGAALNVSNDLTPFSHIVPCGIRGKGVTSLHAIGASFSMAEVDRVLISRAPEYGFPIQ